MKAILCTLFIALTIGLHAEDEVGIKSQPEFLVVSSVKGETPHDSAIFEFQVMNTELLPETVQKYTLATCNSRPFPFHFDASGTCRHVVAPGTYRFQFYVVITNVTDSVQGNGNYYEIYTDTVTIQEGYITRVQLRFSPSEQEMTVDKPVIYLYPQKTIDFRASVVPVGQFLFTYPAIENGWNGTVSPDGTIRIGERTYPYLFWEANCPLVAAVTPLTEGFVVNGSEAVPFLEQQLSAMGLNTREQADFITYWAPRMTGSKSYFVHFLFNESCKPLADLTISPTPDAIFRVYMVWSEIPENATLEPVPQSIASFQREGFCVVEWGGSEVTFDQLTAKTANR